MYNFHEHESKDLDFLEKTTIDEPADDEKDAGDGENDDFGVEQNDDDLEKDLDA